MVIDFYSQYFSASCMFGGTQMNAALVFMQVDSEAGHVTYSVNITFFPHVDSTDFGVNYDSCQTKILFDGKGRRSKKKESAFMESMRGEVDSLADKIGGTVFWDKPLNNARLA